MTTPIDMLGSNFHVIKAVRFDTLVPEKGVECPNCQQLTPHADLICAHCGEDLLVIAEDYVCKRTQ